jgi:hypothetical protein
LTVADILSLKRRQVVMLRVMTLESAEAAIVEVLSVPLALMERRVPLSNPEVSGPTLSGFERAPVEHHFGFHRGQERMGSPSDKVARSLQGAA